MISKLIKIMAMIILSVMEQPCIVVNGLLERCSVSYLQSASLHHHLLSLGLNSGQGEELSLEHHGGLLRVQLDGVKLLLPPFDVD